MDPELSVIIPAYNEENNIDPLYSELKAVLLEMDKSYEIVFVDDCSTDKTFQKIQAIHQENPAVKIIKFRKNFGQSAALQAGFDYARGTTIITLDADLQNDPRDIPRLIEKMSDEDFDIICGWRYNRHDPVMKKIFSGLANRLRKTLTSETIHDSGCTLRIYRRQPVKDIELYGELHRYIPAILQWKGYKIGELQVNHRERASGKTKYTWFRLFKGFLDLLVVSFWQKYSARPMHIFGGSGLIIGFIGFTITGYLVYERVLYGSGLSGRPLFLIGILFIIVGVQFIASGILADIMLKVYYGQKERKTYLIDKVLN